jgi:hypothetical protein
MGKPTTERFDDEMEAPYAIACKLNEGEKVPARIVIDGYPDEPGRVPGQLRPWVGRGAWAARIRRCPAKWSRRFKALPTRRRLHLGTGGRGAAGGDARAVG